MHVGLFSPEWPVNESFNGIVTYVHNLRNELIRQGHRVSVVTNRIGSTNKDSGIHLVEATTAFKVRRKVSSLLNTGAADVFHWGKAIAAKVNQIHRADPLDVFEMEESFGWCADVQKMIAPPVVVKLHGPAFLTLTEEDKRAEFAKTKIEKEGAALRKIKSIIAPSRCTLQGTLSRYQLKPVLHKVIPNPLAAEPAVCEWQFEKCDPKTILFVGRFDKLKGGDTVLIAFRRLLDIDPDLKLIFIGPDIGITKDDGARKPFEEWRNSLFSANQRPQIQYLGLLPKPAIASIRSKAMLTIVTSRWENQPNTLLEAMILGCPVAAFDTGGIGEIIDHEVTGLLAKLDAVDDLCAQMLRILNDPMLARALGQKGREVVIERHSVQKICNEILQAYAAAMVD